MVRSGFFNEIYGDRSYNAEDFSGLLDGIIRNGVFQWDGDKLATTAAGGLVTRVGTGRAWFDATWTLNTTALPFSHDVAHPLLDRMDAIVLEVNNAQEVRANSIKCIAGTAAADPVRPTLINTDVVHQYILADVVVRAGTTEIYDADIHIQVGLETPYVTSVLEAATIDELFNNWTNQFDVWFEHLKDELDENQAANLQRQIDELAKNLVPKATVEEVKEGVNDEKYMTPAGTKLSIETFGGTRDVEGHAGRVLTSDIIPSILASRILDPADVSRWSSISSDTISYGYESVINTENFMIVCQGARFFVYPLDNPALNLFTIEFEDTSAEELFDVDIESEILWCVDPFDRSILRWFDLKTRESGEITYIGSLFSRIAVVDDTVYAIDMTAPATKLEVSSKSKSIISFGLDDEDGYSSFTEWGILFATSDIHIRIWVEGTSTAWVDIINIKTKGRYSGGYSNSGPAGYGIDRIARKFHIAGKPLISNIAYARCTQIDLDTMTVDGTSSGSATADRYSKCNGYYPGKGFSITNTSGLTRYLSMDGWGSTAPTTNIIPFEFRNVFQNTSNGEIFNRITGEFIPSLPFDTTPGNAATLFVIGNLWIEGGTDVDRLVWNTDVKSIVGFIPNT